MSSYEVQGRRTDRESGGRPVRDRVRLACTENRTTAFEIAAEMAADNYTVWIFKTGQRAGRKTFELLGTVP